MTTGATSPPARGLNPALRGLNQVGAALSGRGERARLFRLEHRRQRTEHRPGLAAAIGRPSTVVIASISWSTTTATSRPRPAPWPSARPHDERYARVARELHRRVVIDAVKDVLSFGGTRIVPSFTINTFDADASVRSPSGNITVSTAPRSVASWRLSTLPKERDGLEIAAVRVCRGSRPRGCCPSDRRRQELAQHGIAIRSPAGRHTSRLWP